MNTGRTLVIGLGNLVMGDEGVGIHVVRRLESMSLPAHVDLLDGGTGGYELLNLLGDRKRLIIVDCLDTDAPAGSVFRLGINEIDPRWSESWSAHHGGLREFLFGLRSLVPPPEVTIFGIVPDQMEELRIGLSPPLQSRLDMIAAEVLEASCS